MKLHRARLRALLLGSGVVLLLGFLLWKTRAIDTDAHGRFTDNLRQLKQLDTTLNQDLLKIRNSLLSNYDSITDILEQLKITQEHLTDPPSFLHERDRNKIRDQLATFSQTFTDKEGVIERLKTSSSTLKNSLDYFPKLVQETAEKSAEIPSISELSPLLHDTLQNTLLYNLNGDDQMVPTISAQLELLTQNRDRYAKALQGPAIARIVAHAHAILKYKPQVDTLLQEAIASPTTQRANDLTETYTKQYEQVLGAANRYRYTLYVGIFSLLVYVAYSFLRQQQMADALRVSEDRMVRVMSATNDGIWDWNLQTNEVYFSPRFKEQLGYQDHEFANLFSSFDAHLHPDDKERLQRALTGHFERRIPYHIKFRLRTKNGAYVWIDAFGQAGWNAQGNPVRMSGTHRDISEQKRTEEQLRKSASILAASASQIMATVQQLITSTTETAAAIAQTATTMEEVKQTASVAGEQAKEVATNSTQTSEITRSGEHAVEQAIVGLQQVHSQMESIAQSVATLSEQSKTVGSIIDAVNEIAEQSKLLAVNASIEAAKAGEQGKGFAVVAQEVRYLAQQSKQATDQVQTILQDIQKAANVAVFVTEQGTRAVEVGVTQSIEANQSIRVLSKSIADTTQSVTRIAVSSQQQIIGIDQVASAMSSVKEASTQNLLNIRSIHTAVQQLHAVGQTLQQLVERYTSRESSSHNAPQEESA